MPTNRAALPRGLGPTAAGKHWTMLGEGPPSGSQWTGEDHRLRSRVRVLTIDGVLLVEFDAEPTKSRRPKSRWDRLLSDVCECP